MAVLTIGLVGLGWVSQDVSEIIIMDNPLSTLPFFGNDETAKAQWQQTVEHYRQHFVSIVDDEQPSQMILDIGTGYGWLAISLALFTTHRIIAVDNDAKRIKQAAHLAHLLGVGDRIQWVVASADALPFADRSAGMTFCVEVLEHVVQQALALQELARVTQFTVIVTTPNRLFPILAHDTKLPFCHWLPLVWRNRYANVFGRLDRQESSCFLSPKEIARGLSEFVRVSNFLQFSDYAAYRQRLA